MVRTLLLCVALCSLIVAGGRRPKVVDGMPASLKDALMFYPSFRDVAPASSFAKNALQFLSEAPYLSDENDIAKLLPQVKKVLKLNANWGPLTRQPEQISIAVINDTAIHVLWVTSTTSNASALMWGPSSANLTHRVAGHTWTYNPISMLKWKGNLHGAIITGITPGSRYHYSVGDPVLQVWSKTISFVAPNLHASSVRIALGGDMGTLQLFGFEVAKQMHVMDEIVPFDAFWLIGDIAYSTLDPPKDNLEFLWDIFMRQESPLVNHVPLFVTYGNHDFSGGDSGAFINRFRNPQGGNGLGNFYWSYEHGPIKYISMCTEIFLEPVICNYAPGSPQYLWLVHQLSTVNRTKTPWVIVAGHRPMYSSDTSTDSGPLQQHIEPLLVNYSVDVEVSGHMHATEIVSPVAYNVPFMAGVERTGEASWTFNAPQRPVHLTTGTLGAVIKEEFVQPQPKWSLFRNGTLHDWPYGFVTLQANRTVLEFTMTLYRTNATLWTLNIVKP